VYDWTGDDYNAAEDVLQLTIRQSPAETLATAFQLNRERRDMGHSHYPANLAANLPFRIEDWLPAAVSAAGESDSDVEFLTEIAAHCPWQGGASGGQAIAAIGNPALQAAVAEAWALRWAQEEPEAARRWAETLPDAARAAALCGQWKENASPDEALAACAAVGTIPDVKTLAVMGAAAPEATVPWIAAQPSAQPWHMASAARGWASVDPAAAGAWAATLPEPEVRVRIVTAVMKDWLDHSPEAAVDWLAASPLDHDDRAFICDLTGR
jgi:hypothetical protein